jgi:hypothetical protein
VLYVAPRDRPLGIRAGRAVGPRCANPGDSRRLYKFGQARLRRGKQTCRYLPRMTACASRAACSRWMGSNWACRPQGPCPSAYADGLPSVTNGFRLPMQTTVSSFHQDLHSIDLDATPCLANLFLQDFQLLGSNAAAFFWSPTQGERDSISTASRACSDRSRDRPPQCASRLWPGPS